MILNKIKENCKYSIRPNLEDGKKNMLPYLTNYSPMKGVFVNGKLNDFVFEKMELNRKRNCSLYNFYRNNENYD